MGILFALQSLFIDADELFAPPRVFAKTVIRDPVKPGGKTRFAAKAADIFISAQKSFLGEIIGQSDVATRKLPKQTSHARLMPPDQFTESVLVIIDKNSCDEVCISQLHLPRLRYGRRVVLLPLQLPDDQVANSDEEWNYAQTPGGATPVSGGKKNRNSQADHY